VTGGFEGSVKVTCSHQARSFIVSTAVSVLTGSSSRVVTVTYADSVVRVGRPPVGAGAPRCSVPLLYGPGMPEMVG